jgi:hypothetical protein
MGENKGGIDGVGMRELILKAENVHNWDSLQKIRDYAMEHNATTEQMEAIHKVGNRALLEYLKTTV